MERDIVRRAIKEMKPYSPPLEGRTREGLVTIDFNERTTPPHRLVREAVGQYIGRGEFQKYPEYGDLDNVIADYIGVKPSEVIATNGSDQAIAIIYGLIVEKGDNVILPAPTFAMLEISAHNQGANVASPRYKGANLDFPFDDVMAAMKPDEIIPARVREVELKSGEFISITERPEEIKPGTRLVVICNPNNPTGTTLALDKLEAIVRQAREVGAAVLVDEAYHEFNPDLTAVGLIGKYDNLFVTRSFSKTLGIAGLRAGCVVSQEKHIKELQKIRGPYDINMPAAAAVKALRHPEVVADMKAYASEVMDVSKPILEEFYRQNGIRFIPTGANFHLLEDKDGQIKEFLESKGILVRTRPDPEGTVRVSIGTREDTRKYLEALQEYLSASK